MKQRCGESGFRLRLLIPASGHERLQLLNGFGHRESVRDVDDMYRRLAVISLQLEELGLTHERNVDVLASDGWREAQEIAPLKLLASIVEPVKEYRRGQQRPANNADPLNRLRSMLPDRTAPRLVNLPEWLMVSLLTHRDFN